MCLNAPPLLLGYKYTQNAVSDIDTTVIPLADTYLTLFITIQPTLIPPEPIQEMVSSFYQYMNDKISPLFYL